MMNILITGGSGFVGLNIAEKFLSLGVNVTIYDIMPPVNSFFDLISDNIENFVYVKGDIMDDRLLNEIVSIETYDVLIHAAAITSTKEMEKHNAKRIFDVNCIGTINSLDSAVKNNLAQYIYIGSIAAFGKSAYEDSIITEISQNFLPQNSYQISKYSSEKIVLRYRELFNLNAIILRLGDVFGPWEHPTNVRSIMSAPYQTLKLALNGSKAIISRPNITNWVYSRDVASSVYAICQKRNLKYDIFHSGGPHLWSIEDWCRNLKKHFPNFSYEINADKDQTNVVYHSNFDNKPFSTQLLKEEGFTPYFSMEKAMNDYVKWANSNKSLFI